MTSLPSISPSTSMTITVEPLTPEAFAPFGTLILSPVSRSLTSIPSQLPQVEQQPLQPRAQFANQKTALKTSPISPLVNNYPPCDARLGRDEARGLMSLFSCFPRRNLYTDPNNGKLKLRIQVLERHPFTTQTFCPFNCSDSRDKTVGGRTFFLVVVAPTLPDSSAVPSNPPDLSNIRAFLAPVTADGGVGLAVTYGRGTWHAPMVVLGERRIDFLVTQFANGRGEDDCQEVLVGSKNQVVEVNLAELGLEDSYLWKKAKL